MNDPVAVLDSELSGLCRGRGLQEPRLLDRLGPALREVFGIRQVDDAAEQRRQLQVGLYAASDSLPGDMRIAFRCALGFDPAGPAFVGDRLTAAGEILDRHPRSMRRRLVQARRQVAENLAAALGRAVSNNPYLQPGWHVNRLRSVLRLDLPVPQLTESRDIIVTEDGLSRITANLSLPLPSTRHGSPALAIVAEEGCTLASSEQVSASHWRYELDLPTRQRCGQEHRYVLTFAISSLRDMRPYYVLVPFREVRTFVAEVHFGTPHR